MGVICSCSPRMHEATFRKTPFRAGLNPHMVEIANIRGAMLLDPQRKSHPQRKKAIILGWAAIVQLNAR